MTMTSTLCAVVLLPAVTYLLPDRKSIKMHQGVENVLEKMIDFKQNAFDY
jgi:hypothetical protein